jgi:hypothetical protein
MLTPICRAKAPAAGEDFNVVFIGAGNIMFGASAWLHYTSSELFLNHYGSQALPKDHGTTRSVLSSTHV